MYELFSPFKYLNVLYVGGGIKMGLILGMDLWVFIAWIGTILAAVLCILYGIYHQFVKKTDTEQPPATEDDNNQSKKEAG